MVANRRRFLHIAAAGSAAALVALAGRRPAAARAVWRGVALGAPASIVLDGDASVEATLRTVRDEIARLEGLFSLYRTDSAISRLNRQGRLDYPDPDLLSLLSAADRIHAGTGGVFDPTVQPVWSRLARIHTGSRSAGEPAPERCRGWRTVRFDATCVRFTEPGVALTLNGIAQGFITDRVAMLLKGAGLDHLLIDIGEVRAIGARRDRSPWPVRVPGPDPAHGDIHWLDNRALAVSHSHGTTFDTQGRYGHIVVPGTAEPLTGERIAVVEAPSATVADGLSTALCAMAHAAVPAVLSRFPETRLVHYGARGSAYSL